MVLLTESSFLYTQTKTVADPPFLHILVEPLNCITLYVCVYNIIEGIKWNGLFADLHKIFRYKKKKPEAHKYKRWMKSQEHLLL